MKQKSRSEYGARLFAARKKAGLTQTALAKAAGMSQSAYQEAETTGLKSTYTAQLAAACRVSPQWLATGEGSMEGPGQTRREADELADALKIITKALQKADENTRIAVEPLLSSLALKPSEGASKSQVLLKLLVTNDDLTSKGDDQYRSPAPQSGALIGPSSVQELGGKAIDERDTAAAAGGRGGKGR